MENEELIPLIVQGRVSILKASDKLIEHLVRSSIEHCVLADGIAVLESEHEGLKQFETSSIDNVHVGGQDGIGYEIDEDTWNTLRSVYDGSHENLDNLHIEWLAESGLIIKTDSGRLVLTEDAKTWISSKA
jgi:hypothetical protein